jgi:hypothetical protein
MLRQTWQDLRSKMEVGHSSTILLFRELTVDTFATQAVTASLRATGLSDAEMQAYLPPAYRDTVPAAAPAPGSPMADAAASVATARAEAVRRVLKPEIEERGHSALDLIRAAGLAFQPSPRSGAIMCMRKRELLFTGRVCSVCLRCPSASKSVPQTAA